MDHMYMKQLRTYKYIYMKVQQNIANQTQYIFHEIQFDLIKTWSIFFEILTVDTP